MKTRFTLVLILIASSAFCQTTISGRITDKAANPIALANVLLLDTYDGASSDSDGKYIFSTTEEGTKILLVKFVGFKAYQVPVTLSGKPLKIDIVLEEEISELKAVTISAGTFAASDESRRTVFKAMDIATTAGATADIAGALNTLPGTQKVGETGRLFVRGGEGNETRTFIDGMLVLDAYGPSAPNTPSRGRFLPFMFKGTSFSTGGYSAEYGQALSSTLVLDSRDKAEMTRTDIGILSVGGDVTHTQAWGSGSISGKLQYTNIRPYYGLINQEIDWKTPPESIEGISSFRQQVGKTGMVKLYGNFSRTNYSLYNHDIDDYNQTQLYDLTNNYNYINASYKDVLSDNWVVRGGLSYTLLDNNIKLDQTAVGDIEKGLHAKTVFEGSISDQLELKTGAEVINRNYEQALSGIGSRAFDEVIAATFVEADLYASNNFVTRVGGRVEYNNRLEKLSVDPRLSMAYKTGSTGQVSFAYGRFRQSAKNEYLRINTVLNEEKAEHFILNYQRIDNNRTFRIETYYKRYSDLVKYTTYDLSDLNATGDGFAKGVELFWRDNRSIKNIDYWVSYSFLDTKRNYLNFSEEAMPSFASRHNFSVVGKYFVQKLKSQVGATYSYTSPRPYNDLNSDKTNSGRTPYYTDLSINWSYLPKPYIIIHLSCTNLFGRDNIFGYEYGDVRNEKGLYNARPIRQAATRFLFVGIFITLSKDKSVNQLPTL